MSEEWINENLRKSVGDLRDEVLLGGYSRHLFFSPAYHPSGSPLAHMRAKTERLPPEEHAKHDAFHYDEDEVKKAVNKRKSTLRKKYGNLLSLKAEQ